MIKNISLKSHKKMLQSRSVYYVVLFKTEFTVTFMTGQELCTVCPVFIVYLLYGQDL